jgi:multidrug transporter EmrE-like cation transporter
MGQHPYPILLGYALLLTAGQALFKAASQQSNTLTEGPISFATGLLLSPFFLMGCLLYAISTILWVAILNKLPLSQAYPMVIATSILFTTLLGVFLFKEQLTPDKMLGMVLVSAGVAVLSRSVQ